MLQTTLSPWWWCNTKKNAAHKNAKKLVSRKLLQELPHYVHFSLQRTQKSFIQEYFDVHLIRSSIIDWEHDGSENINLLDEKNPKMAKSVVWGKKSGPICGNFPEKKMEKSPGKKTAKKRSKQKPQKSKPKKQEKQQNKQTKAKQHKLCQTRKTSAKVEKHKQKKGGWSARSLPWESESRRWCGSRGPSSASPATSAGTKAGAGPSTREPHPLASRPSPPHLRGGRGRMRRKPR